MIHRMTAALLSLVGLFISAYLYLYKIGKIGTLACGTGSCETVQLSSWSRFAGLEVSLIGVLGYAGLLLLSLVSLQPSLALRRWPSTLLALLAGGGVGFSVYLTYLELFVIHAICRWCVASALVVAGNFVVASMDRFRRASGTPE
jgi:uncharacterized membrane protein